MKFDHRYIVAASAVVAVSVLTFGVSTAFATIQTPKFTPTPSEMSWEMDRAQQADKTYTVAGTVAAKGAVPDGTGAIVGYVNLAHVTITPALPPKSWPEMDTTTVPTRVAQTDTAAAGLTVGQTVRLQCHASIDQRQTDTGPVFTFRAWGTCS